MDLLHDQIHPTSAKQSPIPGKAASAASLVQAIPHGRVMGEDTKVHAAPSIEQQEIKNLDFIFLSEYNPTDACTDTHFAANSAALRDFNCGALPESTRVENTVC